MDAKICGIKDINTLSYIINHKYPPKYIGFITNYKKSKRYVPFEKLRILINVNKKNISYYSWNNAASRFLDFMESKNKINNSPLVYNTKSK